MSGGSAMPAGSSGFVARLNVGGVRGCSAVLVAPQWVVTAANCFANDGKIGSGAPALPTTATIGGTDVSVVRILAHGSRDVVLARLSLRIADVTPITVSGTAAAAGEAVQAAGYDRTATEWVPDRPYAAPVSVGAAGADSFTWTGQDASACQGDAGGPVFRAGAQPELVGITLVSGQGGCLDGPDTGFDATAVRVDDLKSWITANTADISTSFRNYYNSSTGVGSYDLADTRDRVVAFDYDHSAKLDHLVLYRPGSRIVWVVKHGAGNTFTAVYNSNTAGIGTWDLSDPRDELLAFDYEHSGKLDHLLLYRPGTGWVAIVKHGSGNAFGKVFASTTGIGGYNVLHEADRIVAFDYDHSRKADHLVLYRPGSRIAWVVKHGAGNTFTAVYNSNTAGIGGYDLAETRDQLLAYDYDYSGKLDHLVLYRPGAGIVHILKHGAGNSFAPVVNSVTGIGGYDLKGGPDRIVAFDRDHSGGPNHLFLHRPGSQIGWVVGRTQPPARVVAIPRPITVENSIMEGYRYPGAAEILAQLNVRLIAGDGHILLADCTTAPVNNVSVVQVWTTEQIGPDGQATSDHDSTG